MASSSPTVAILLIGNELLTGKIVDSNGVYAVKRLTELGATVTEVRIVRDGEATIAAAINELRASADWVLTSGGIGPTHDDLTMPAVAAAFAAEMEHRPGLQEHIDRFFGEDPVRHRVWSQMAWVPVGCQLIHEDGMYWPVYRMENVYVLPGVPQIFVRQFDHIAERFRGTARELVVLYLSVGEGRIAEPLTDATKRFATATFGSYPVMDNPEHRTRVTIECDRTDELERAVSWLKQALQDAVVRVERNASTLE